MKVDIQVQNIFQWSMVEAYWKNTNKDTVIIGNLQSVMQYWGLSNL